MPPSFRVRCAQSACRHARRASEAPTQKSVCLEDDQQSTSPHPPRRRWNRCRHRSSDFVAPTPLPQLNSRRVPVAVSPWGAHTSALAQGHACCVLSKSRALREPPGGMRGSRLPRRRGARHRGSQPAQHPFSTQGRLTRVAGLRDPRNALRPAQPQRARPRQKIGSGSGPVGSVAPRHRRSPIRNRPSGSDRLEATSFVAVVRVVPRPCARSPAWHHQHDLLDARRICRIAPALVPRCLTAAMTRHRCKQS
jgi:hypothetical protein